ncbi:hypothetical protein DLH72_02945 [Candidatus Gracilibacteria bacterium]|nr:MAG: hypothetical protein DLH72_02945 [Candidatus Gracilibacteria bacterium]
MAFKKKKIKKSNTILNLFGLIIILFLVFLGVYAVKSVNLGGKSFFNSKISSGTTILEKTKNIKKEINILLIGRGGVGNDAPQLTDTIILAKLNSDRKIVSLLSIQRDLYVNYPDKDGHGKINSVYAHYYFKELKGNIKSEEAKQKADRIAIEKLASKIKDITGETVDYYVNVDFDGFKKVIDTIGGVEIDVKEDLVDRTYPDGNWGYQTISFKKGLQVMNGDQALKYSRSRHSTSDFDRSLRQQQVIQAVKERLKSSNLDQIKNLYNVFLENLTTDVGLNDVINLVLEFGVLKENYKFISSNFNDTCWSTTSECKKGGILYVPKRDLFGGQWVSLVNGSTHSSLSNYELVRKYSDIVLNTPLIEEENYEINIFNGSSITGAWNFVNNMKRYGFKFTEKNPVGNAPEKYEKSIIYYNGISKDSDTINALKKLFKGEFVRLEEPKYSTQKAKIEIIIGKDYGTDKNIFNF